MLHEKCLKNHKDSVQITGNKCDFLILRVVKGSGWKRNEHCHLVVGILWDRQGR